MTMEALKEIQLLRDGFEALPEAVALFDADDRFVFWNARFSEIYGNQADLRVGLRFVDHLRACVQRGEVPSATGKEEAWLAERMARFTAATGVHEHKLANGRWVRVQDRRLSNGGRIGVRTDITEVKEREQTFRMLFDDNPIPMIVADAETHAILAINDAAVAFYGHERSFFLTLTIRDIRPEREPGEIARFIRDRLAGRIPAGAFVEHRTASGEARFVRIMNRQLQYDGRSAVVAAVFDLTEQHKAEEETRRMRTFLTEVVDQIPTALFVKDMADNGRFITYNQASENLFGRSRASVIGKTTSEIFGQVAADAFIQSDQAALRLASSNSIADEEIERPDGSRRTIRTRKVAISDGMQEKPSFVLGVSEDVTERRADEARIAHMAHHDALTDLPNRFLFNDRLGSALARLPDGEQLAVLFIDLDGFKAVNDAHGHGVGDQLLRLVSDRVRTLLHGSDTAARFGGDEFAVLRSPMAAPGEAAWLAAKLVAALAAPYEVNALQLKVSASIGVALAPMDAQHAEALIELADVALYEAKRAGKDTYRFARHSANPYKYSDSSFDVEHRTTGSRFPSRPKPKKP